MIDTGKMTVTVPFDDFTEMSKQLTTGAQESAIKVIDALETASRFGATSHSTIQAMARSWCEDLKLGAEHRTKLEIIVARLTGRGF